MSSAIIRRGTDRVTNAALVLASFSCRNSDRPGVTAGAMTSTDNTFAWACGVDANKITSNRNTVNVLEYIGSDTDGLRNQVRENPINGENVSAEKALFDNKLFAQYRDDRWTGIYPTLTVTSSGLKLYAPADTPYFGVFFVAAASATNLQVSLIKRLDLKKLSNHTQAWLSGLMFYPEAKTEAVTDVEKQFVAPIEKHRDWVYKNAGGTYDIAMHRDILALYGQFYDNPLAAIVAKFYDTAFAAQKNSMDEECAKDLNKVQSVAGMNALLTKYGLPRQLTGADGGPSGEKLNPVLSKEFVAAGAAVLGYVKNNDWIQLPEAYASEVEEKEMIQSCLNRHEELVVDTATLQKMTETVIRAKIFVKIQNFINLSDLSAFYALIKKHLDGGGGAIDWADSRVTGKAHSRFKAYGDSKKKAITKIQKTAKETVAALTADSWLTYTAEQLQAHVGVYNTNFNPDAKYADVTDKFDLFLLKQGQKYTWWEILKAISPDTMKRYEQTMDLLRGTVGQLDDVEGTDDDKKKIINRLKATIGWLKKTNSAADITATCKLAYALWKLATTSSARFTENDVNNLPMFSETEYAAKKEYENYAEIAEYVRQLDDFSLDLAAKYNSWVIKPSYQRQENINFDELNAFWTELMQKQIKEQIAIETAEKNYCQLLANAIMSPVVNTLYKLTKTVNSFNATVQTLRDLRSNNKLTGDLVTKLTPDVSDSLDAKIKALTDFVTDADVSDNMKERLLSSDRVKLLYVRPKGEQFKDFMRSVLLKIISWSLPMWPQLAAYAINETKKANDLEPAELPNVGADAEFTAQLIYGPGTTDVINNADAIYPFVARIVNNFTDGNNLVRVANGVLRTFAGYPCDVEIFNKQSIRSSKTGTYLGNAPVTTNLPTHLSLHCGRVLVEYITTVFRNNSFGLLSTLLNPGDAKHYELTNKDIAWLYEHLKRDTKIGTVVEEFLTNDNATNVVVKNVRLLSKVVGAQPAALPPLAPTETTLATMLANLQSISSRGLKITIPEARWLLAKQTYLNESSFKKKLNAEIKRFYADKSTDIIGLGLVDMQFESASWEHELSTPVFVNYNATVLTKIGQHGAEVRLNQTLVSFNGGQRGQSSTNLLQRPLSAKNTINKPIGDLGAIPQIFVPPEKMDPGPPPGPPPAPPPPRPPPVPPPPPHGHPPAHPMSPPNPLHPPAGQPAWNQDHLNYIPPGTVPWRPPPNIKFGPGTFSLPGNAFGGGGGGGGSSAEVPMSPRSSPPVNLPPGPPLGGQPDNPSLFVFPPPGEASGLDPRNNPARENRKKKPAREDKGPPGRPIRLPSPPSHTPPGSPLGQPPAPPSPIPASDLSVDRERLKKLETNVNMFMTEFRNEAAASALARAKENGPDSEVNERCKEDRAVLQHTITQKDGVIQSLTDQLAKCNDTYVKPKRERRRNRRTRGDFTKDVVNGYRLTNIKILTDQVFNLSLPKERDRANANLTRVAAQSTSR